MCPELTWSSSSEVREVQGRLRSPPRSVSPHRHMSPTLSGSPGHLDSALQAVQATIERRQQREQVVTTVHGSPEPQILTFMELFTTCPGAGGGGGAGGQVSIEPASD